MSIQSKVINVRLSPDQAERFQRLKSEFSGLPKATVLRLLIASYLDMPLEKQVEILTRQIRRPEGSAKHQTERLHLNENKRH